MSDPEAAVHPNVALVRRLYDAFATLDLDTILALVDPAVEVVQTEELPWGGHFYGHEGLGEFFTKLRDTIESQVTVHAVFAAGDRVVQVGRTAGTVVATGAAFDIDEVHVHTVVDGRIVRFEAFIDTSAMLAAFDA